MKERHACLFIIVQGIYASVITAWHIDTDDEILAACNEMEARLNGTWISTEEDEVLQQKYWRLICDSGHNGGRIGAQFLGENQDLLRE